MCCRLPRTDFASARNAPLDLRGMTLPRLKRKQQLTKKTAPRAKEVARRPSYTIFASGISFTLISRAPSDRVEPS
jgi:hypothetical protein